MSLYDFMKENNHLPFPRHHVQKLARQLLESVACESDGADIILRLIHPCGVFQSFMTYTSSTRI